MPLVLASLGSLLDRLVGDASSEVPASFRELVMTAGLDPARDFVGASLKGIDLRGEDLRGFNFSNADLTGADLRGANLTGVWLHNARLEGVIGFTRPSKKILIVEDNSLNLKLMKDVLQGYGYQVSHTDDGVEALRMARKDLPNLILMDIQLPEISGLEVTKWMKEDNELKNIPIIAVTAFAMLGDENKIREGGCEGYISKPVSIEGLLRTVERFLT